MSKSRLVLRYIQYGIILILTICYSISHVLLKIDMSFNRIMLMYSCIYVLVFSETCQEYLWDVFLCSKGSSLSGRSFIFSRYERGSQWFCKKIWTFYMLQMFELETLKVKDLGENAAKVTILVKFEKKDKIFVMNFYSCVCCFTSFFCCFPYKKLRSELY